MASPSAAASSVVPSNTEVTAAASSAVSLSAEDSVSTTSTASSSSAPSTTAPPTYIFSTPSLDATFTPPPECTEGHITMLERQQYFIWQNEPLPVPNTTFTECYPSQFITSYLQSYSGTIAPAFSPLVCPENYETVFSQTVTNRPMYIACCPSSYGLHPPDSSTPGRPAYGGTCYSDITSVSVTQYDNSSSSGVMLFSTPGQAYAHPIDGFALDFTSSASSAVQAPSNSTANATATATATASPQPPMLSGGAIAGIVIGCIAALIIILAAIIFFCAKRRRPQQPLQTSPNLAENDRYGGPPNSAIPSTKWVNEKALPLRPPGYNKHAELASEWPRKPSELSATYTSFHELPDHTYSAAREMSTDQASNKSRSNSPNLFPTSGGASNHDRTPSSAWMRLGGRSPGTVKRSGSVPTSKYSSASLSPKDLPPLPTASPDEAISPVSATERSQRLASEAPSEVS